jgi:pimeloyl-ACP methyl ester carboxylesterase
VEIVKTRFQVCPIDLIGCGANDDWHGHGPITLSAQAALVEAMAAKSFGPVHLIGHSHGGAVTLAAAMALGERVASLTLIEPSLFHILKHGDLSDQGLHKDIKTIADTVGAAVLSGNFHGAMACFIDYWSGPGAWDRIKPMAQERLAAHAVKTAMDFSALFNEPTALMDYARITAPVLILRGMNSPAPSRRICEILAQTLPDAMVRSVANAGHMLPMTHSEMVNPMIEDHIESRQTLKSIPAEQAA